MIVKSISHAEKAIRHLLNFSRQHLGHQYLCFDTETEGTPPYPSSDALIIGRAQVLVFSMCVAGSSYCFPTSNFNSKYPTEEDYGDLLRPFFADEKIVKVMHNANYDLNVIYYSMGVRVVNRIWDTMIAAWKAAEYKEKGLKSRAPVFGRLLRETKTVDFNNLKELADYAEQDVVATDELYQAQMFGKVVRRKTIINVTEDGAITKTANEFYNSKAQGEVSFDHDETLSEFDKQWLKILELPVLRATMRAERFGFPFDKGRLYSARVKLNRELRKVLRSMYQTAGRLFNPNSGKDLTEICSDLEIANPFQTKTKKQCFNAKALNKLAGSHPFLTMLSKYKSMEKLVSTYIGTRATNYDSKKDESGLEYYINPETGCVHPTMNTVGAITGRFSSSNPNGQNIPARKDTYGVKACFVAVPRLFNVLSPKHRNRRLLMVLDYSQLELRVMALYCKDKTMTCILSDEKGDIHQHTADTFGVPRQSAKNLNFLLLYGGRAYMLAETLTFFGVPTSEQQADGFYRRHTQVYPRVAEYRMELVNEHQANGEVILFTGRTRTIPDIDWDNKYAIHKAETTLSNNVVQGAGQDFLKAAIVRTDHRCINPDRMMLHQSDIRLPKRHRLYLQDKVKRLEQIRRTLKLADCRFRLQVHDEAIFTVLPSAANECLELVAEVMSWRHFFPPTSDYNVPLVAEGGTGESWQQAKSKEPLHHVTSSFDDWKNHS